MTARSFLVEHRIADAQKVYDERLRNAVDLSIDERRLLALLLVDMNRAADAILLLKPQYDFNRDDDPIAAALVQAYVQANRRLEALELIGSMSQRPFKDTKVWLQAATQLYAQQAFAEARAILQHIHAQDPGQTRAALDLARVHLRLCEVDVARQILDAFPGDRASKDYLITCAEYHLVVGEYTEAIAIAKRRLVEDPHDVQSIILLGNAFQSSAQLQMAEVPSRRHCKNVRPTTKRRSARSADCWPATIYGAGCSILLGCNWKSCSSSSRPTSPAAFC